MQSPRPNGPPFSLSGAGFSLRMCVSFPLASYLPLPMIYLVTGGAATLPAGMWRSVRLRQRNPEDLPLAVSAALRRTPAAEVTAAGVIFVP